MVESWASTILFISNSQVIHPFKIQTQAEVSTFEERGREMADSSDSICKDIPSQLSSFVDTFVDFAFSGLFFSRGHQNPPLQTTLPAPNRLVAIGDLHGDLTKSKEAFRIAGLIDGSDRWIGGNATVVQVGDVLDRGGDELKILYFLEKLKSQASRCGGSVITMIGNHEIMNVEADFRFVARSALREFKIWADWFRIGNDMKSSCVGLEKPKDLFEGIPNEFKKIKKEFHEGIRARIGALRPSGPISSRFLSESPTVLVIGESVFVHGGLLPGHVSYGLERINEEVRDWINGLSGPWSPDFARGRNAVVWLRKFSEEAAKNCDCKTLEHVLATIPGAKRMIMGHTIQSAGINGVCENQAIRIDVGLSKGCGDGVPEVLEINRNSDLKVLVSSPLHSSSRYNSSSRVNRKEGLGSLVPEQGPKQIQVEA